MNGINNNSMVPNLENMVALFPTEAAKISASDQNYVKSCFTFHIDYFWPFLLKCIIQAVYLMTVNFIINRLIR